MMSKHHVSITCREAKVLAGMLHQYSKYLESRFNTTPDAASRLLIYEEFHESNTLSRILKEKADA